jgi:DNA-binding transcriptional regulator YiaG
MANIIKPPEPKQIKDLRMSINYTQEQSSSLLHVPVRTYQRWEQGTSKMAYPIWELFLIKAQMVREGHI